ncbi:prisilkin-39-like [Paramacrobiotus metropolitanus]|uniref:prisilkin-39-like n=1 Tax=Paramacrobiotus metropolitanus TaxID=2943436 RepID=UPI0024456581|nr:prisilkin-39-like [Paramacrobiotus metropolitanus]
MAINVYLADILIASVITLLLTAIPCSGQAYGGYAGRLGGYSLAGSYSNFVGNCTPMYSSSSGSYGSSYGSGSSYGGGSYGYATTAAPGVNLTNCGYDADAMKVFGYYGYDFPKPPIGLSYPNIGWPYSIPYPYYTPPPYGPIGIPYYGTPVVGYNPYLFGFGSYDGIYGGARGGKYEIKEVPAAYKPSNVYKGYKFGPGGQIIAYY